MKLRILKLFLILLTISSAACSTIPEGPVFTKAAPPTSQQALVYFYRPDTPPSLRSPDIFINGIKVIDMKNQGYSYIYMVPNRYSIQSVWSGDIFINDKSLVLDAKGGKTYFVKQNSWMKTFLPFMLFDGSFQLVAKLQGMNEIMQTHFVPPFVKTIGTSLSANQKFPVLADKKNNDL